MFSAITLKTWRDLWLHKKQSMSVIIAIAISSFTLGTILICYGFLAQALQDNFQRSAPAMVTYQLRSPVTEEQAELLTGIDEVNAFELSRVVVGSISNAHGKTFPLYLFVVRDFENFRVGIVDLEQGHWPDKTNQIVIEKQAMSVLKGQLQEQVSVSTPWGLSGDATIVAVGHDVAVAQAEWENVVYAYVSNDTFVDFGGEPGFNRIKVRFEQKHLSADEIRTKATSLLNKLNALGFTVDTVSVASGEPPHANITSGMFMMQIVFGVMCCLLSAILVINLMSSVLSKQIVQIAIMKSLGAKPDQIRNIYLRSTLLLCTIGVLIGLPLAWLCAGMYAEALANMMNIEIFDYGIPGWVVLTLLFFGFAVPLLVVVAPILRTAKLPIRKALMDYEADGDIHVPGWLGSLIDRISVISSELRFSARNIMRNKTRFLLTMSVMAFGGGILMTAFNVTEAMQQAVQRDSQSRLWQSMIRFADTIDDTDFQVLRDSGAITFYQSKVRLKKDSSATQSSTQATILNKRVAHLQVSNPSALMQPKMLKGHWLAGDKNYIVFSQLALRDYPQYRIGDSVTLDNGESYTLVGIAETFHSAMIYSTKSHAQANGVYIRNPDELSQVASILINNQTDIASITKARDAARVIVDHFEIVFAMLLLLAGVTLLIAGKSVVLTTAINVQERTREIGVLKAIGASKRSLYMIILGEGLWSAILAWTAACIMSLPVSWMISWWVGHLLVSAPFPLAINIHMLMLTLPVLLIICLVSAWIPARRISHMSAKAALAYV